MKPVLAVVHGACIGGGVDLVSACDMRLATKDTYFQIKVRSEPVVTAWEPNIRK